MAADSRWARRHADLEPNDIRAAERRVMPGRHARLDLVAHRPWPVIPRPGHAPFPRRVAGLLACPECGMSQDHHWDGCSKPAWTTPASGPIR